MSEANARTARDFVAGLSARHDPAATQLKQVFAERPTGFSPADLISRIEEAWADGGPKHYAPADPAANPTQGWDPLDPRVAQSAFIDPIEVARTAGYDEGFAAARAGQAQANERDRSMLSGLVEALGADGRLDREHVARQLRQTVLHLVTRLVGEIGVSADLLAARIAAATDLLANSAESAMLRVNPADVALLEGKLPQTIFAVGDAAVARGGFVLEAASTIVEDGPELWLEQLAAAIERIPVPKC